MPIQSRFKKRNVNTFTAAAPAAVDALGVAAVVYTLGAVVEAPGTGVSLGTPGTRRVCLRPPV